MNQKTITLQIAPLLQVKNISCSDTEVVGTKPPNRTFWEWLELPFTEIVAEMALNFLIEQKKLKPKFVEAIKYKEVEVNLDQIASVIFHSSEHMRSLMSGDARYLVVGRDVQSQLLKLQLDEMVSMSVPSFYKAPIRGYYEADRFIEYFCGLQIIFVPWMKGFVILPEVFRR